MIFFNVASTVSRALNAFAIVRTLLTSRTTRPSQHILSHPFSASEYALTAREHHPDEIHEEVVPPEVEELRPRICNLLIVVIEHAGGVVENEAVDLTHADDDLEGMAQRMRGGDEGCYDEAQRSPGELCIQIR